MHSLFQSLNTTSEFDGRLNFLCTSRGSSLHVTEERDVMLRDIVRFSVRKIQRQEDGGASVVRFSVRKMEVHLSVPVPPGGA